MMEKRKNGFTLAEVLITLTTLGIIASLTIPSVIQKQREAANRTKIKKAMTVYDYMVSKISVENNLKSAGELRKWADADCTNTSAYFKIAEKLSTENNCTFRVPDGVYWDITDITKPIIALDKKSLNVVEAASTDNKKAFFMVTSDDPITGALRINDLQYEIANNGETAEMQKLLTFVKPEFAGKDDVPKTYGIGIDVTAFSHECTDADRVNGEYDKCYVDMGGYKYGYVNGVEINIDTPTSSNYAGGDFDDIKSGNNDLVGQLKGGAYIIDYTTGKVKCTGTNCWNDSITGWFDEWDIENLEMIGVNTSACTKGTDPLGNENSYYCDNNVMKDVYYKGSN